MIETIEEEIPKSTWELDNDEIDKLLKEGLGDHCEEELVFNDLLESSFSAEEVDKERSMPLEVELKPLPSNLQYNFLGENSTYPIIINIALNDG